MRFAVVDNGVVVGVMAATSIPTVNVPPERMFVDITNGPDVVGGEIFDKQSGVFRFPPAGTATTRLDRLESDVALLKARP